jgi:nicotianamine synthase
MKVRSEEKLVSIKNALLAEPDLFPRQSVNHLFEELIGCGRNNEKVEAQWLLANRAVFNQLCAEGEALLEKYWVEKFLLKGDLQIGDLREFQYFQNYEGLSEWEIDLIVKYSQNFPKKILLVGSGSLPLSAILMSWKAGVSVECWDCDSAAVEKSVELVKRLGVEDRITVKLKDFFLEKDFKNFDLVLMAALVGINELDKIKVVKHLEKYLLDGQVVLLRTVEKLKTLFYQPVELEWLRDFKNVQIFNPDDFDKSEIINSVILAKK